MTRTVAPFAVRLRAALGRIPDPMLGDPAARTGRRVAAVVPDTDPGEIFARRLREAVGA